MGSCLTVKIQGKIEFNMVAKVVLSSLCAVSLCQAQLFGQRPSPRFTESRASSNQIVDQVIDKLSPAIAQAVANALRGSSSSGVSSSPNFNNNNGFSGGQAAAATPAKYDYQYKIADDGTQTYISQQESRDGLEVVGTYSYVDPTGAIVTVNYNAGVNGYQETRERQEGAVRITPYVPRNEVQGSSRPSNLDSDAIIQQVLSALQPVIQQSVSSVINNRG